MSATDPLSLLREYTVNGKPLRFKDADGKDVDSLDKAQTVVFGDTAFPRGARTVLRKKGVAGGEAHAVDDASFHTLDSLIFCVQFKGGDHFAYAKAASDLGVAPVSFVEKKGVYDFLTGVTDHNDAVEQPVAEPKAHVAEKGGAQVQAPKRVPNFVADLPAARLLARSQRVLRTRRSPIKGSKSYSDVRERALELLNQKQQSSAERSISNSGKPADPRTRPVADPRLSSKDGRHHPYALSDKGVRKDQRIPIIVVPAAMTSLLTMHNIKDFLEKQHYVSSNEIKESGAQKMQVVMVRRQTTALSEPILYQVVDTVDKFKHEDWDRVVCVITNGAAWQFRSWPWKSPQQVFRHVKGYYVKFADEDKKDAASQTWNVEYLNIHRTKRHADKATVTEFWDGLDGYMAIAKPHLLPGRPL